MPETAPLPVPAKPMFAELSRELETFRDLPTADLRAELSRSLELTAVHLTRLAAIVRTLEERGEDLSDLRLGILTHLRRIAYGQALPELVVRFATFPSLLRYAGSLPRPDQEKLARGEPVPLVSRSAAGVYQTRLVDPANLSVPEIRQILGPNGLRDEPEQIAALDRTPPPAPRAPGAVTVGRCVADRRRGGIRIGRTFVTPAEIVAALAALAPEPGDGEEIEEEESSIVVRLPESQHTSLKLAAARGRTDMQTLVRRALKAYGLLDQT